MELLLRYKRAVLVMLVHKMSTLALVTQQTCMALMPRKCCCSDDSKTTERARRAPQLFFVASFVQLHTAPDILLVVDGVAVEEETVGAGEDS